MKIEEEVGNSMCSVEHKYRDPVYLVHVSTFTIAKLLEYLGWFQTFVCYLASNCSWHVYVIVPWLTLLFSFNNSSHFLFTSLIMCIYRQLSLLPLNICLLCKAQLSKLNFYSLPLQKRLFSSLVSPAPVPIHPNSALRG